jgi:hypothetical protein
MPPKRPPPAALIAKAAELRAAGSSWEAVAREVGRATETVRKWPAVFPDLWQPAFRDAKKAVVDEVTAESVLKLREQLRSEDEKIVRDAAQKLIQFRVALGKQKAAKQKADRKPHGLDLSGMTDAELDALYDRLLPAYLADRERRERANAAVGPVVP